MKTTLFCLAKSIAILPLAFLFAHISCLYAQKNDGPTFPPGAVTIFVYPPSDRMDFSRPGKLLRSTLAVELKRTLFSRKRVPFRSRFDGVQMMKVPYRSTIGHTICYLECTLPDGSLYAHWASFSAKGYTPRAFQLLTKEGAGLDILLRDYEGGFILGEDENLQRLIWYQGPKEEAGRAAPRYLQFPVQSDQCADMKAMVDFFEQFHSDTGLMAAAPDVPAEDRILYFTNKIDPYESYTARKRTGAGVAGGGCAPFGVALLKVGRLYDPSLDIYWQRPLVISERLIGEPDVRKVPVFSILFGRLGRRWEHEGYESRRLQLYDPSMIWKFIVEMEIGLKPADKSGTATVGAVTAPGQVHLAGFNIRQGVPIALSLPEFIHHRKYPKWSGRRVVHGIVMERRSRVE